MDGTLPAGREIFRYSRSVPTSITNASMTTIDNLLGSSARTSTVVWC
jgi:hypothetical protein